MRKVGLAGLVLLVHFAGACTPGRGPASEATINTLASYAYIVVGDVELVLPYVSLPEIAFRSDSFSLDSRDAGAQDRFQDFRDMANNEQTAPIIDKVKVSIHPFGWNDFDASYSRICPRLDRDWSKAVCNNNDSPIIQSLPRNGFYLFDSTKLASFDRHISGDGRPLSERLHSMTFHNGRVVLNCDGSGASSGSFCVAAIGIERNLAATWTVWTDLQTGETAGQMAEREGKAIVAFVEDGASVTENYAALLLVACDAVRPRGRAMDDDSDACIPPMAKPSGRLTSAAP